MAIAVPRRTAVDYARQMTAKRVAIFLLNPPILHLRCRPAVVLAVHTSSNVHSIRLLWSLHVKDTRACQGIYDDDASFWILAFPLRSLRPFMLPLPSSLVPGYGNLVFVIFLLAFSEP